MSIVVDQHAMSCDSHPPAEQLYGLLMAGLQNQPLEGCPSPTRRRVSVSDPEQAHDGPCRPRRRQVLEGAHALGLQVSRVVPPVLGVQKHRGSGPAGAGGSARPNRRG